MYNEPDGTICHTLKKNAISMKYSLDHPSISDINAEKKTFQLQENFVASGMFIIIKKY